MHKIDSIERCGEILSEYAKSMQDSESDVKRGIYAVSVGRLERVARNCKVFTDFVESQRKRLDEKNDPSKKLRIKPISKKKLYGLAVVDWDSALLNLWGEAKRNGSATAGDCIYLEQYLYEWFKIRVVENDEDEMSNFNIKPEEIWKMVFALCVSYSYLSYRDSMEHIDIGKSFAIEFDKWAKAIKQDSSARDTYALPKTASNVYHFGHRKFEYSDTISGVSLFKHCVYDRIRGVKNNDEYGIPRGVIKQLLEE